MTEVDDVRHLIVAGHAAPWEGENGRRQQQLGVSNACDLARRFQAAGIEVVLADFVTTSTVAQYRRHLQDVLMIRLQLPLDEGRRRARQRPIHLIEQEFDDLYRLDATATPPVDHVLDVAHLDLQPADGGRPPAVVEAGNEDAVSRTQPARPWRRRTAVLLR